MTTEQTRAIYKAIMTKNTNGKAGEISARILTLVATGLDIRAAFDAILGAGTWDAMIDDLYEALRA